MTSEEYHGTKNTFSSSQLKAMLQDPEVFYKKYISKELPKEESSAFDVGTYFHTALLEPEKLDKECIVFQGAIRRGAEWETFKEQHKGKAIISKTEKVTADKLIAAVKDSPISMKFLETSKSEVSAFVEFYVMGKEVFAFRGEECFCLMPVGWVPTSGDYEPEDIKEFGVRLVIKVRADSLGVGTGVISDLKSTSGNAKKAFDMQSKVSNYEYDLSAALYLDVFTLASGEEFHTFVWIFASKDVGNAKSWKASDKNIMVGRMKYKHAIIELAKYVSSDWQFNDELGVLDPPHYALDWLSKE
jgi:hypothetical protein